jgi:hypothetical protein
MELKTLPVLTMFLSEEGCEIAHVPVDSQELTQKLALAYPYGEVSVEIYSLEVQTDGTVNASTVWKLWEGKIYSLKKHLLNDYISIVSKNVKYYTDVQAGVVCVEGCAHAYFGDTHCGKAVYSENVTVNTISGLTVGFTARPSGVNHLYRSGYLEYEGLEITIKEWTGSPGTEAELVSPAPASWLNKLMKIYAGCNRTYETCRDIHNNTTNGLFLGLNMVDYNAYFELE